MIFFTILAGFLVGLIGGKRLGQYLLVFFYQYAITNKKKFLDLYDLMDNEFHFQMYQGAANAPPKKYEQYLKLHQANRPRAYKVYKEYIAEVRKETITLLVLLGVVPTALLFFTYWYAYLATFLLTVLGYSLYYRFKKNNNSEFHAIVMVSMIFNSED